MGYYELDGWTHGYLLSGTTYTNLDDPLGTPLPNGNGEGTWAFGIDGNNIVGCYVDSDAQCHGFLYDIRTQGFTTIDNPLSSNVPDGTAWGANCGTFLLGISGSNAVGYYTDANGYQHGFLYDMQSQVYTTLDDPYAADVYYDQSGNTGTQACGISGSDVVGYYVDKNGLDHGFIYDIEAQSYGTLNGPPNGYNARAYGIDGNFVVGWYEAGYDYGFIYNIQTRKYGTLLDSQDPDIWAVLEPRLTAFPAVIL